MSSNRDENEEPTTLEELRQFVRDLLVSPEARAHLAKKALTDDKFLLGLMKLATSDPKDDESHVLPASVNVRILTAVTAMTPEAQLVFAETGKLPERYWELQGNGNWKK